MFKNKPLYLVVLLFNCLSIYSQVGIGTTNPDPSSILEVNSTSQGILIPRMTTDERSAIVNPAEGLMVYDTDLDSFYFFNGVDWNSTASSKIKKTGWVAMTDGDYSLQLAGITTAESTDPSNFTDIELDFTNNAADNIIQTYAPTGYVASDFYDSTTHRLTPLATGDAIEIRLQFEAIPTANNAFMIVAIDIGNPNGTVIYQKTVPLLRGADNLNKVSESILLYQLGTFLANGAILRFGYATSSGAPGSVQLSNFNLVVTRLYAGD